MFGSSQIFGADIQSTLDEFEELYKRGYRKLSKSAKTIEKFQEILPENCKTPFKEYLYDAVLLKKSLDNKKFNENLQKLKQSPEKVSWSVKNHLDAALSEHGYYRDPFTIYADVGEILHMAVPYECFKHVGFDKQEKIVMAIENWRDATDDISSARDKLDELIEVLTKKLLAPRPFKL